MVKLVDKRRRKVSKRVYAQSELCFPSTPIEDGFWFSVFKVVTELRFVAADYPGA